MMKLICKNILIFFVVFGFANTAISANPDPSISKKEFVKTIKKNFKMSADGQVTLSNKYGKINLKTWDRNEVNVEVKITVDARTEANANEVFQRININFSNGTDYVKAITEIESQKSSWWGSDAQGEFRIDYEVSIPKSASIDLSNQYGDAEIGAIGGNAIIAIKYGNFNVHSVGKNTTVNLGYGNGSIGKSRDTDVSVKYSKINLIETGDVKVESKYSKVYIDKAEIIKSTSSYDTYRIGQLKELVHEGKYDHFEIESVDKITTYSKYTHFKIGSLHNSGSFELNYGGLTINELRKGFKSLSLNCGYTECKIYLEGNSAFQLDAITEYASISYPSDMEVTFEKIKSSSHEVKGYRGKSNAGMIKAVLKYGGLKLK